MFDMNNRRILAAIGVAGLLLAPLSTAQAQKAGQERVLPAPVVAVIDFKRAVEGSLAGRSIVRQIGERHARIQKEIAKDTAELEKSKQQLERRRALVAPEVFKKE